MSTYEVCDQCGAVLGVYEDDQPYVEVPAGLCMNCRDDAQAFDEGFAAYEARAFTGEPR